MKFFRVNWQLLSAEDEEDFSVGFTDCHSWNRSIYFKTNSWGLQSSKIMYECIWNFFSSWKKKKCKLSPWVEKTSAGPKGIKPVGFFHSSIEEVLLSRAARKCCWWCDGGMRVTNHSKLFLFISFQLLFWLKFCKMSIFEACSTKQDLLTNQFSWKCHCHLWNLPELRCSDRERFCLLSCFCIPTSSNHRKWLRH